MGRESEVEEEISSSSSLLHAHMRAWRGASLGTEKFRLREREGEREKVSCGRHTTEKFPSHA